MKEYYPQRVFTFCPVCGARGFSPARTGQDPAISLLCRECGFEYFTNAGASIIALIEKEPGLLLMTRRLKDPAKGTLDLPGGFVDPRERAEDAAAREIFEECSLVVTSSRLLNKTYWNEYCYGGITYFTLDLVFSCEVENWDDLSEDGTEVKTLLIQKNQIHLSDIGLDSVRNVVTDYLQDRIR